MLLLFLYSRQKRELSGLGAILKDSNGQSLEPLLLEHMKSKVALQTANDALRKRVEDLEKESLRQVGNVGIVRYNAFEEIGGDQSFVLAMVNEFGDGFVINSITGRAQAKLYAKAVRDGRCEQTLCPEEEQALRIARSRKQVAIEI